MKTVFEGTCTKVNPARTLAMMLIALKIISQLCETITYV